MAVNLSLGLAFLLVCLPTLTAWGAGSPFLPLAPFPPPPLKIPENTIGATLCVNTTGTGGCYTKIQDAINAATTGDTINVAAGTYKEHITMKDGVSVYGQGWDSTTGTVIDGEFSSATSVVRFSSGITSATVLSGVQVTRGGSGDPNDPGNGGGISITGSPTIQNTLVHNCTGYYGGGIYISYGSPTLNNVPVWNCRALYGGGFYITYNAKATIIGNPLDGNNGTVWYNTATTEGGGFHINSNAVATITGLRLWFNTSGYYGGGVNVTNNDGKITFQLNHFYANQARMGSGLYAGLSSKLEIIGNWIDTHTAELYGGGIALESSPALIQSNMITNNKITSTSGTGGGIYLGLNTSGTQILNNHFENNSATYGGALYLYPGSSCLINANAIVKNSGQGAGIMMETQGQVRITNNLFAQNTPGIDRKVLAISGSTPQIINNTFADNQDDALSFTMSEGIVVANNNITGNTGRGIVRLGGTTTSYTADYNNVYNNGTNYDQLSAGPHDTSVNPHYVGSGNHWEWYHIQATSPIRNTGSNTWAPVYDMDGDWRLSGGTVSMGADEIPGPVNRLFLPVILK